jgi:hypothetical protein
VWLFPFSRFPFVFLFSHVLNLISGNILLLQIVDKLALVVGISCITNVSTIVFLGENIGRYVLCCRHINQRVRPEQGRVNC